MQIAFVIPDLRMGGTQQQLWYLSRELVKNHEIHILVLYYQEDHHFSDKFTTSPDINVHSIVSESNNPYTRRLRYLSQIIKIFRTITPDIIQAFLPEPNLLGSLAGLVSGSKAIFMGHRATGNKHNQKFWKFFLKINGFLTNHFIERSICNSQSGLEFYRKQNYDPDKLVFIPNGIEIEAILKQADKSDAPGSIDSKNISVGQFSRINPKKGIKNFLTTAQKIHNQHPETVFYIAGRTSNSQEHNFVRKISHEHEEYVKYLGHLDNPYPAMEKMDIIVSSSRYGEGMSNSIMEAMTLEKPIVATDVGDTSAILNGGNAGIIVPPEDSLAMAKAIKKLIDNRNLRQNYGKLARKKVQEYSISKMTESYISLYRKSLSRT